MNHYLIYTGIWVAIATIIILLFKYIPRRMKETESSGTKSFLFMILMVVGLPLILFEFLAPIIIIMGNQDMPANEKIYFGIIVVIFIFFFMMRNKVFKGKDKEENPEQQVWLK